LAELVHLLFDPADPLLETRHPLGENELRLAVGTIELGEVAIDAVLELLPSHLDLANAEVLVPVVDRLELAAIDRDDAVGEQLQPSAQQDELATDVADGGAVVLAEVGDGLEVGGQATGEPHQFDVALCLAFQASARLDLVEV